MEHGPLQAVHSGVRLPPQAVDGFEPQRATRATALVRRGWLRQRAEVVAFAETPWPDSERFTAEVWIHLSELNAEYLSAVADRDPDIDVALAAVRSYLAVAERLGAVSWSRALRRVLSSVGSSVEQSSPPEAGSAPHVPTPVGGLVPAGASLLRFQRLQELRRDGLGLPLAAARAFLETPWLDGVLPPSGFVDAVQEFVPMCDQSGGLGSVRDALEGLRDIALDHDADDYVMAVDGLMRGVPVSSTTDEEQTGSDASQDDDPLGSLTAHPEFWSEAGWLRGGTGDRALHHPISRLDVDFDWVVPRALFDGTATVMRQMMSEAHIACDAASLFDVVQYVADDASKGLKRSLKSVRVSSSWYTDSSGARLVEQVGDWLEPLTPRERLIVDRRLAAQDRATLEQLGLELGVTKERVRQLQEGLEERLSQLGPGVLRQARLLERAFGGIAEADSFLAAVERCVPGDAASLAVRLARALVVRESGYGLEGDRFVHQSFQVALKTAKLTLEQFIDERGFVDEEGLWSAVDLAEDGRQDLIEVAGLARICGFLMRADTHRYRAYAALASIGRPATRQEIAELLGVEPDAGLGNSLSAEDDIVKVTKDKWGFREWTDRPYEGIAEEIARRVELEGGVVSVKQLMEELPSRYEVSEASVNMYLGTPRFDVRDGEVRLATRVRSHHRSLDNVDGVVTLPDGTPVLEVKTEERYLSGYSINIPPAAAEYLGVQLGGSELVPVASPEGFDQVSVIWRSHSTSGPHIGRTRPVLQHLGLEDGDVFYIELRRAGLQFSAGPAETAETGEGGIEDEDAAASVDAVIDRMKARRRL